MEMESAARFKQLKEEGNQFYHLKNFNKASSLFTEAIETCSLGANDMAILFSNRSACFFALGEGTQALLIHWHA